MSPLLVLSCRLFCLPSRPCTMSPVSLPCRPSACHPCRPSACQVAPVCMFVIMSRLPVSMSMSPVCLIQCRCVGQADNVYAVVADKELAIRNGLSRSIMKRASIAFTCCLHAVWSKFRHIVIASTILYVYAGRYVIYS